MIRGLALVEAVGQRSGTVSELSRRLNLDKAIVSRLVTVAESEGWLVRQGTQIVLGPRGAALGRFSEARDLEAVAHELAHALAGVTGLDAMVLQFAADRAHPLALAPGLAPIVADLDPDPFPLFTTAIGLSLAVQLDDDELDQRLAQPLQSYTERSASDPAAIRARLAKIRSGAVAREDGEYAPGVGCLALPWPHPLAAIPTSISLVGPAQQVDAVEVIARRALIAAVRPGASRATVVAAAAD
jgi:DNA-binding IclR family transcriptional regulator